MSIPRPGVIKQHQIQIQILFVSCSSGYQLYSRQMLKELKDVENNKRMKVISEKWKNMTDDNRAVYNDRRAKMWEKYCKEQEKFILVCRIFH